MGRFVQLNELVLGVLIGVGLSIFLTAVLLIILLQ